MSKHNSKTIIRLTILGDKDTGKTSFIKTYLGDEANKTPQRVERSGSAYNCDTVVEETNVIQQILDSDGKHIAVTAWAHGVIVLYSVNNKDSFNLAEQCISNIKEVTMRDATIMLVGNKVDSSRKRVVSIEEGEQLAAKYDCGYIELSALYDESDVSKVFYEMTLQILIKRGLKNTSILRKPPQIFRRMLNAVTKHRTLSTIKEPPHLKETFI